MKKLIAISLILIATGASATELNFERPAFCIDDHQCYSEPADVNAPGQLGALIIGLAFLAIGRKLKKGNK